MTLAETKKIDLLGVSTATDACVLTIVDAEDWSNPDEHLQLLQEKLNSYLAFIESGELFASYPKASGRAVGIDILHVFPVPEIGLNFLKAAATTISEVGFGLTWSPLPVEEKSEAKS